MGWLERLLGIDGDTWSEATGFAFAYGPPAWGWGLIVLAVGLWSAWLYHRQAGSRARRGVLATLRALTLLWVVVLLCGPRLVEARERVERDVLLVLVDRSRSMTVPAGGDAGPGVSRDALAAEALAAFVRVQPEAPLPRDVVVLGFGSDVFGVDPLALQAADRSESLLRSAVSEALRRVSGRPLAGVVVLSDGRSPEGLGGALRQRLVASGVPVFAVPLGEAGAVADVSLARVEAPRRSFLADRVPVSVTPRVAGVDPARAEAGGGVEAVVELVDRASGEVLASEPVLGRWNRPLRLEADASVVGPTDWTVRIRPAAPEAGAGPQELNTDNNSRPIVVEIVDRPLRVLYVEGLPRWEYRYLKNLLIRERSIDSSVLLLAADGSFAQEGDTPITRLPRSPEELEPYDVLVIGDVPASALSAEQAGLFRSHVERRGAGLLWLGGPVATPRDWADSALSVLLPMRDPSAVVPAQSVGVSWGVRPTELASALSVLRLGEGGEAGVFERLPGLRWVQVLGPLKATAEVLAEARLEGGPRPGPGPGGGAGPGPDAAGGLPVLTRLRAGAGQVVYVGTDETWRWRRGVGERYPERFWVQVLRLLGRESLNDSGGAVRLASSSERVAAGEPVVLDVTLAASTPAPAGGVSVGVRRLAGADGVQASGGALDAEVLLQPVAQAEEGSEASGAAGREQRFRGRWTPERPGSYRLRPTLSGGEAAELVVEVEAGDQEMRDTTPDPQKLVELARATGGRVLTPTELAGLADPASLPSVARRTADDRLTPLMHAPLAFAVLLLLLGLEWVGRRLMRLA